MRVVAVDGSAALCEGRSGPQRIDVALVEPIAAGEWLLTFLGSARRRLAPGEAARIDRALDALEAIGRGAIVDVAAYFPDLCDREPELPEHLRRET